MLPGHVSGTCCVDTSMPWCALALFLWCNVNSEQNFFPICCMEYKLLNIMGHDAATELRVWRHDHRALGWPLRGSVFLNWVINGVTDFFFFCLVAVVFQALCIPQNCIFLELWNKHWTSLPYKLEGVIDRNTQLVVVDWFVNEGRHLLST